MEWVGTPQVDDSSHTDDFVIVDYDKVTGRGFERDQVTILLRPLVKLQKGL